ncbi:alpha/beta fold hydrolase [Streptomyces sp. NPDC045369]|uniref:alpha/beta fold hydrolase n=1 Tax=Streptomyces sp. NPDC045369 TaxID=3155732 RepID=UPI0034067E78
MTAIAHRLATPSRYGGDAADAFTVIVPSLPGFAFSPQRPSLTESPQTHEIWHRLLRDELGYERYAAHGRDLGAGITSRLGEAHPEAVVGIHLTAVAYDAAGSLPRSGSTSIPSRRGPRRRAGTCTSRAPARSH